MPKRKIKDNPRSTGYKTIFAPHYFEGENTLARSDDFWVFHEFHSGEGIEKFLKTLGIESDEDQLKAYNKFIEISYPEMYKLCGDQPEISHVMGIQFEIIEGDKKYNERKEKTIGRWIYEDVKSVLSSSSGDDSYFDYDPGFAEYGLVLLRQLAGCKEFIDHIEEILAEREI